MNTAPKYADYSDFCTRYGRTPSADEDVQVTQLIIDAEALVDDIAGDAFDSAVPGTIPPVVCEAVRRVVDNPGGLNTERLGDYSWSTYSARGGVYLTEAEQRVVRRAAGIMGATSVSLSSDFPFSLPSSLEPGRR